MDRDNQENNDSLSYEEVMTRLSSCRERLSRSRGPESAMNIWREEAREVLLKVSQSGFSIVKSQKSTTKEDVQKYLEDKCLHFFNNASKMELLELEVIGEQRLKRIMDCREQTSKPFKTMEDIEEKIELSKKEMEALLSQIFINARD